MVFGGIGVGLPMRGITMNPIRHIAMETYSFGRLAFEAENFRPVKLTVGNK